jgi:hypothetical protein
MTAGSRSSSKTPKKRRTFLSSCAKRGVYPAGFTLLGRKKMSIPTYRDMYMSLAVESSIKPQVALACKGSREITCLPHATRPMARKGGEWWRSKADRHLGGEPAPVPRVA